jgi:hypothetical protein
VRRLRTFDPPTMDGIAPMSYSALQSAADGGSRDGRQHYWKASSLRDVTDDVIDVILGFVAETPSAFTGVGLQQLCGAASRVKPNSHGLPPPRPALRLSHSLPMG